MGTMLAIGGVIGLILWLSGAGGSPAPEEEPKPLPPPKPVPKDMPQNGVFPGVTMSLKRAQQILIALGYDLGSSGADGIFLPKSKILADSKTHAALIKYQDKNGLEAHGFLDQATADQLASESIPLKDLGKDVMTSVAEGYGYSDGYSNRGLNFEDSLATKCAGYGATDASGNCLAAFKDPYTKSFKAGAFKRGQDDYTNSEGTSVTPTSAWGSQDWVDGWNKTDDVATSAGGAAATGLSLNSTIASRSQTIRDRAAHRRSMI